MKSVTTGTVINSFRQVFVNHCLPKPIMSRNVTQFSSTLFDDFNNGLNIPLLLSPANADGLDEKFIDNVEKQLLEKRYWKCFLVLHNLGSK